jgi:hypothetical protein
LESEAIALAAREHMQMKMGDFLAGGGTVGEEQVDPLAAKARLADRPAIGILFFHFGAFCLTDGLICQTNKATTLGKSPFLADKPRFLSDARRAEKFSPSRRSGTPKKEALRAPAKGKKAKRQKLI